LWRYKNISTFALRFGGRRDGRKEVEEEVETEEWAGRKKFHKTFGD